MFLDNYSIMGYNRIDFALRYLKVAQILEINGADTCHRIRKQSYIGFLTAGLRPEFALEFSDM